MSTVIQILNADVNLKSMVKAIKAAGLEETLNGEGPFTILAPVNLAFSQAKPYAGEELLTPSHHDFLTDLLNCCIVTEKKLSRNFLNGQKLKTIHGRELQVTVKDGEIRINGARILGRDRQGSNGVVHSTDSIGVMAETPAP